MERDGETWALSRHKDSQTLHAPHPLQASTCHGVAMAAHALCISHNRSGHTCVWKHYMGRTRDG